MAFSASAGASRSWQNRQQCRFPNEQREVMELGMLAPTALYRRTREKPMLVLKRSRPPSLNCFTRSIDWLNISSSWPSNTNNSGSVRSAAGSLAKRLERQQVSRSGNGFFRPDHHHRRQFAGWRRPRKSWRRGTRARSEVQATRTRPPMRVAEAPNHFTTEEGRKRHLFRHLRKAAAKGNGRWCNGLPSTRIACWDMIVAFPGRLALALWPARSGCLAQHLQP